MPEQEDHKLSATAFRDDPSYTALLFAFLRDRDVPCPLCGYNLRALPEPRCPECGQEIRLSIAMAEPYLRAWIVLMTATGASAGIGVFFIFVLLSKGGPPHGAFWLPLTYFFVSIPVAFLVLRARKALLKLGKSLQWTLAIGVSILSFLVCIVLVIFL